MQQRGPEIVRLHRIDYTLITATMLSSAAGNKVPANVPDKGTRGHKESIKQSMRTEKCCDMKSLGGLFLRMKNMER